MTPSGTGCRIWGLADGASLNRKFTLEIDGKDIAAELFRRTNKALTITGYKLDTVRQLTNIDRVIDWAIIWGERRKAAAAEAATQKQWRRQRLRQRRLRLQYRRDRDDRAVPARLMTPIAAICFTPSSATISDVAGMSSRYSSTCSNFRAGSAPVISVRDD